MNICIIKQIIGILLICQVGPGLWMILDHCLPLDYGLWKSYRNGWAVNLGIGGVLGFALLIEWLLKPC